MQNLFNCQSSESQISCEGNDVLYELQIVVYAVYYKWVSEHLHLDSQ